MAEAIACSPASPVNSVDACEISASGLAANDAAAYDTNLYPTEPQLVYYFKASATGEDDLISPRFSPAADTSADVDAEWHTVVFPAAGTWTVGVYADADDSEVVATTVTVS